MDLRVSPSQCIDLSDTGDLSGLVEHKALAVGRCFYHMAEDHTYIRYLLTY